MSEYQELDESARENFRSLPRWDLEDEAMAIDRNLRATVNRCSTILQRARDLRTAMRAVLEAKSLEEYAVACSHARIVLELPL